jgi:hypothetical protein
MVWLASYGSLNKTSVRGAAVGGLVREAALAETAGLFINISKIGPIVFFGPRQGIK